LVLKSEIESDIYFKYREAQQRVLHTDRLPCIHISDLLKECQRYVVYDKITPQEYVTKSTEDLKSMFFGQMLHQVIKLDPKNNEVSLLYDWVEDKPILKSSEIEKLIITQEPNWDWISGTIDDIVKVKDEYIICDKKTTGKMNTYSLKKGIAYDNHKAQTNMYRVLLLKCMGIDAKWGCNIYISNNTAPEDGSFDKPRIIPYKLDKVEETLPLMLERAKLIKGFMTDKKKYHRLHITSCVMDTVIMPRNVLLKREKILNKKAKKWNVHVEPLMNE